MSESIHKAVDSNDESLLEQILKSSPGSISEPTPEGHLAIHLASWHNKPNLLRVLLMAGADINARGQWGWTPLHYAAFYTSPNSAEFLAQNGADVNQKNNDKRTPLYYTIYNHSLGSSAIMGCLLHNRATLDLECAVALGITEVVRCMLQCEPNLVNSSDNAADLLSDATQTGQVELVQLLLRHGANPNVSGRNPTPLEIAADSAFAGDTNMAQLLLANGADPDIRSKVTGVTPREWAEATGNTHMLALFSIQDVK